MRFIKTLLVMVATIKALSAYENADVRFEVEKLGTNRLTIRAFEGSRSLFNQTVDRSFNAALVFGQNVLSRHGRGYKILYRGRDNTSLGLEVDQEGNISIANSSQGTGFAARKSWGFKTAGIITHTGESLFFEIFTKANAFHNHGILKAYTGECLQDYLFNKGIIHFGNDTSHVNPAAYVEYLGMVDGEAQPSYEEGIIDDRGVILAEKGLRITNLTYRPQGLADIGVQGLELENAGIDNRAGMNVDGPIRGTMHHFTNSGAFFADSMDRSNLTISHWSNSANVYLSSGSDIFAQDSWNNTGQIFVRGDSSVGCRKKPQALGVVIADGVIKNIIEEAMDEASSKALFGNAAFFSGKQKIIINRAKHTDHYLNTITEWYNVYPNGFREYSHTTETGNVFQRRTTENTLVEEEIEGGETPEQAKQMKRGLQEKRNFLKALKSGIKDRLKKLGLLHTSQNAIMAALMKGLNEAGLSSDDIDEIFGGEGSPSNLLDIVSAYEQLPAEGIQRLQSDLPAVHSFLSDISSQAQRAGVPVWQWVQRNGPEFVEGFCNLAILTSRFIPHPVVTVPARVCTLGQLAIRPCQNLQKAHTFYSKKHGDGGKPSDSGPRVTNPPKAESPIWRDLKPHKGDIKTNGLSGKDKRFYQWDNLHNEIEMYNRRGKPIDALDPRTGARLFKNVENHKPLEF
jgi:hypothetical protein